MGGLLSYRQGKSFSHCSNLPQSRHISCHIQRGNFFLQFLLLYGSQILQYWEDVIRMITIQKILITRKATRRGQKKVTDRDRFTSISIYAVKYFAQPHLYSTKPVLKHSSSLFTCHAEKHSKHSKKKEGYSVVKDWFNYLNRYFVHSYSCDAGCADFNSLSWRDW